MRALYTTVLMSSSLLFFGSANSMNLPFDPLKDGISSLALTQVCGSDLAIVNAARISHNRSSGALSKEDCAILENLIKEGHGTPFEQTFLQYRVKLPIFVARHWMRHRVGVSYNEQSARYTQMKTEFYVPKQLISESKIGGSQELSRAAKSNEELKKAYSNVLVHSSDAYEKLLESGVSRELARCVLPVSLYTQFMFGCNMRSLFHFVSLRANKHAQWEIQQYAKGMLHLAQAHFPKSVEIWCKHKNVSLVKDLLEL